MFLEEKRQGEVTEASAKTLKLSEAIRIGAGLTGSTKEIGEKAWVVHRHGGCFTCLVAAAWIGSGLDLEERYGVISSEWMGAEFNVPLGVCADAHLLYEDGKKSREQIADWLEAQGF